VALTSAQASGVGGHGHGNNGHGHGHGNKGPRHDNRGHRAGGEKELIFHENRRGRIILKMVSVRAAKAHRRHGDIGPFEFYLEPPRTTRKVKFSGT